MARRTDVAYYTVKRLLPVLREAVAQRRELIDRFAPTPAESTSLDNAGVIRTIEGLLEVICFRLCYPGMPHTQQYKRHPNAEISVAAYAAREANKPIRLEHVMPQRAFARRICELIEGRASNEKVLAFIRKNFRLVVITPEEMARLNKVNRTLMTEDRIAEAHIDLMRPTSQSWPGKVTG